MNYKFSVLISIYYKEVPEYLDLALKSITDDQLLKPNQIVLVKDGPLTKELELVIRKYLKKYDNIFKIILLEKNYGLGKALNIGLVNCDYELVARMDGDDISKPERFKEQIEIFRNNSEIDLVGSWIDEFENINNEFQIRGVRKVPEKNEEIYEKLKTICVFNHPTVMYKKSKVLKVGSYLSKFLLEDYYLWIRLAVEKIKFYNIQKSLVYFRVTSETSKRRGGLKLLKSDLKFQRELLSIKFISKKKYIKNIIIWGIYRILPWKVREILQKKIMRVKK